MQRRSGSNSILNWKQLPKNFGMKRFLNRADAGRQLADLLSAYRNTNGVVLAVPRGGVPVACEVALALNLPMDVVLVKKLGHPLNKEYAIGAVGLNQTFFVPHEGVYDFYLFTEAKKLRQRLQEMKEKFMGDLEPEELEGKTVIVIDDGVATGKTLLATLHILRKSKPDRIVVAVPVISPSALRLLAAEADEIIAVLQPEVFHGVGAFYDDFRQLTDKEVVHCIRQLSALRRTG